MVVFKAPYAGKLNVKVPNGVKITRACVVNGEEVKAEEIARNEFNVDMPSGKMDGPFVIKLTIDHASDKSDKYLKAKT